MRSALIICFSLGLILSYGCSTVRNGREQWPNPSLAQALPVEIIPMKDAQGISAGFWISNKDAKNLVDNVDELKAYIEKLEVQIKKMKEYYGDK